MFNGFLMGLRSIFTERRESTQGVNPSFDEDLAFANKSELQLAKIQIRIPDFRANLTASVLYVKEFLFSIKYEGSVNYFEEAAEMDPRPMFLIDCEVIAELSQGL